MNFDIPARTEDYRARIADSSSARSFRLRPTGRPMTNTATSGLPLLKALRTKARAEGLWCLQLEPEKEAPASTRWVWPSATKEMNRSIFGPVVFNSAAPDDGNMMMLEALGTPEQKERWLKPIVKGEVPRLCDDRAVSGRRVRAVDDCHPRRTARRQICRHRAQMVHHRRRGGKPFHAHRPHLRRPRNGLSALLFHKDQPGWRILRRIEIMGPEEHGGHCELEFDGLEIPVENLLAGEGREMKVTQVRLGPARLTHCMRWLGLSKRCIRNRNGLRRRAPWLRQRLADRESVQLMLGDLAMPHRDRPECCDEGGLGARPGWLRPQGSVDGQDPGRQCAS